MCLARGESRPRPWDAPPGQGCSELRAAALALLYLLASGPGHGGDEPLRAHVALSPHQGRVQLWDWCWWEAAGWPDTSLHICLCLCVLLPETGAAPASPSPAHSWVFVSLGMGEANPAGHRLLLLLPVLCVEIPEPRKDKCAVWGCRADGWSPWDCGFAPGLSGMVFADPGPSTGELPALCPPWQSPGTWEAGGTLPLGNTSARFPGNMKQSKSSPRHASPSSVAGGHRGELRGEQAEGNQNSFLQPSARFPKSFAALASEAAITQTCPLRLHEAAVLDAAPHFEVALLLHSRLKVH